MKTIEERALAYSEQVVNDTPYNVIEGKVCVWQEDKDISEVAMEAYIAGAEEQKPIDIDKACEWLRNNIIDYIGVTVRSYNGEDEEHIIKVFNEFFIDFRKAMEE